MAPAGRVYVGTVIVHPVIVHLVPTVEVKAETIRVDLDDGGDADQNRVASVKRLHLHPLLKTVRRALWGEKGECTCVCVVCVCVREREREREREKGV